MNDRLISDLHPDLQPLARQFIANCEVAGIDAFIDQTYRDADDQNADYAQGRTTPGHIITNAKFGQSPHNVTDAAGKPAACAFDFAIKDATGVLDWDASDSEWQAAIKIGQALGLVSGATWCCALKDSPHMELPNWKAKANIHPLT